MNSYSILNKSIKVGGDEEKYLASLAEDNGRSIVSLVNDMKKVAEEAIVAYVEKLEVRRLNKGGEK